MSHCSVEQVEAGSDVRAHRLFREALKESQVFESRSVEDDVRLRLGDEGIDECWISQVTEDEVITGQKGRSLKTELSGVQAGFVPVGHDKSGRLEPGDLTAQL